MTNEKRTCNQICHWNDPSDGCVKPNGGICPMSSAKVDASGWGQVKMANEKRLTDTETVIRKLRKANCAECDNYNAIRCRAGWVDDVVSLLEDSPTVDAVEVVHGEWIDGGAIHNGKEVYKSIDCSHCEEVFKIESHDREYWKARFKVCPFCGAVMDGGKDNVSITD